MDLDLSPTNLPNGQRLTIGSVVVEITVRPDTGCTKFSSRFGADGLRFINLGRRRDLRFRGICARVIEAGEVSVGADIAMV